MSNRDLASIGSSTFSGLESGRSVGGVENLEIYLQRYIFYTMLSSTIGVVIFVFLIFDYAIYFQIQQPRLEVQQQEQWRRQLKLS